MTHNLSSLQAAQTARIQVRTDLRLLSQVLTWFNQFYQPTIPKPVWLECRLALAEGFTNAVRHGHRNQPAETPVEIGITLGAQAIEIRIWDYGLGFDLDRQLGTKAEPLNLERASGRGLQIIQKMADVLRYETAEPDRNCLVIIRKFAPLEP